MEGITKLEKSALFTTGAAAAFKTLLWSLEASIDSQDPYIGGLRVVFAVLSFVAFDLVIGAVVYRGWSLSGAAALAFTALVSALIALDVAKVWPNPALHAAPALTLAAFSAHLMWARRVPAAVPAVAEPIELPTAAPAAAPIAHATAAVQVNVAPAAALPRTVPHYIAARAAELPQLSNNQLAAELGTSPDTVRRALVTAGAAMAEEA